MKQNKVNEFTNFLEKKLFTLFLLLGIWDGTDTYTWRIDADDHRNVKGLQEIIVEPEIIIVKKGTQSVPAINSLVAV